MTTPRMTPSQPLHRVAPYIAARTPLSRRQAEEAIRQGRVHLHGQPLQVFALPELTGLTLDGKTLPEKPFLQVWKYHKPRGQIVTHYDPQDRLTVFEAVRDFVPEGPLVSVGRLDYASEGLLLLTNRPRLAHYLESSRLKREYWIRVKGNFNASALRPLARGACIEGIQYLPCQIKILESGPQGAELMITLQEGKNREVRILMQAIGLTVTRLVRLTFGPFRLGPLLVGQVEEITPTQLSSLPSSALDL